MIEEKGDGLFRIRVPSGIATLSDGNAYLLRGPERDLLVDNGYDAIPCRDRLFADLVTLGCRWEKLDLLLTHSHRDHAGLTASLAGRNSRIYISHRAEERIARLRTGASEETVIDWNQWGLQPDQLGSFHYQGQMDFCFPEEGTFIFLHEGNHLNLGEYHFSFLETPGHCEDHGCLYDPRKKLLFCGDMILDRISPSVFAGYMGGNVLEAYLDSLRRLQKLQVKMVYPGHGESFSFRERAEQLAESLRKRLSDVLMLLDEDPRSAGELAPKIKWYYAGGLWDAFSVERKVAAVGETFAMLEYLKNKEYLRAWQDKDGSWRFSKKDNKTGQELQI